MGHFNLSIRIGAGLAACLLMLCPPLGTLPCAAQGQNSPITVKGTVLDESGLPVIGASVVEKGTANGTVADMDGVFTLSVTAGATLDVSCIGYTSKQISAAEGALTIILAEDNMLLSEVVVTALGIKREQKALSYSVQEVKGEQLTNVRDANFVNALSGKVAGVVINSSSAGAGGASRIIMRGTKSLEKDDNALYVIDGIPMFTINSGDTKGGVYSNQPGTSSVADINPDDIESISVLTGPSAAALYGSDASNGVVLITTKKGAEGKLKISFNNSTSFSNPAVMPEFQNTYGNIAGQEQSWGDKLGANAAKFNPMEFFRTGYSIINGLTMSVGNDRNQTYASVSATNSQGILPNSGYDRYNFSIRNTSKFAGDKLTLDLGAQYIIQNSLNMIGGGQYHNPLLSLYLFPRSESFEEIKNFERYDESRGIYVQYWPKSVFGENLTKQNPYWTMNRMLKEVNRSRYMLNGSLKWDITSWLNVVGRVRVDNSVQDVYSKRYASTLGVLTESSSKGFYGHEDIKDYNVYADFIANISKNFADDKLSLNANVGASINDIHEELLSIDGGLDKLPNFFHIGNLMESAHRNETRWHDQVQSVFGSVELGWDHMLYLTLTGRNDWDSRLAFTSKNSYFYPSAGLSWVVSELIPRNKVLSYLKLRASWAEVASAPDRYLTLKQYVYSPSDNNYALPENHYDTNLKPENTRSWELGFNSKFADGRINFDLTFYRSNTFNQTFIVDASASSGYKHNIVQTGNIMNQGIESALGYSDSFAGDKVKFSTNFTFTLNQNRIVSLANGAKNPETGEEIKMDYYSKGELGTNGPVVRLVEGGSMGDIYTNQKLARNADGTLALIRDEKGILYPTKETTDYYLLGSILPKFHLGWNLSLSYAGFDLNMQLAGRFGGLVVSDTQAIMDQYGVSAVTARARDAGGIQSGNQTVGAKEYYSVASQIIGENYTYDATNIRLSEVSLNYNLPRKWFRDKVGLSIGFVGRNLCMLYCNAPFDPESTTAVSNNFGQGVDYFNQPSLRNMGFNIKLTY
ncbi:MAG: SusC/RagA family TonB-linked outer membrane protein [Bacteroidales bacterium]|nr:SusC/RagA family TonB-linked outer membrane protein [Bacteroidales bacterium]